ncbi:hypothetical protein [uncultured Tateyamaria sp.]|uniref:hypothetical protein n=1 Tax=uncultured Tateyamaria sp. TaxID=455651 RepID=UPI00261B57D1|nr:hypothetical protein [uncultured Tateyamaria sp.]
MKKKQIDNVEGIIITADEKRAVYERLLRRNHIRAEVSLPALDIPKLYHREIEMLVDRKYRDRLEPYLKTAYEQFPGSPGIPGRIKQHHDVMAHARQALFEAEGINHSNPETITFQKFMMLYTSGKLPLA